ncbi:MAG: HlyD family type I secretion periplasmic adaptor subunit [Gammaproteobacteria bacterium]|nr:HlyD family type I secretion periplasmic adaptor subunit [Gammaproteobacteria bacterium]
MFSNNKIANKATHDADLAYMRSLAAAVVQRSPRHLVRILLIMALFIASAVGWMSFAEVDVVVRGSGKVIPSQQMQVIQSLEGGVVSQIMVKEGEIVEPLQPLIKISDVAFSSSLEENRLHYLELRAKITRLRAEANGAPFEPDEEVARDAPKLLHSERSLFETNRQQMEETLHILEEQMRQHQNELLEAQAKRRQLRKSLNLMREELKLKEPLVERRLVSEVEYLQLQQREAEMEGNLEAVDLSIPRVRSTIEEGRRKIEQSRLDFRNKAKRELNETVGEASRIAEAQSALQDRVQRTTLRSPLKGTVTRLHINTVGGVIPPSTPILEIVPYEDALLVEIRIKPADIANISAGQFARLKFSAYDFAIYGSIEGEVIFLSADTVTNEEGESFFISRIKPARTFVEHQASKLPIRVGMTAEVDILTDKKTILQYLFKPIGRGLQRALREE